MGKEALFLDALGSDYWGRIVWNMGNRVRVVKYGFPNPLKIDKIILQYCIEKLSLEKSDLYDNQCQGQQVDGYTALFKCFMIQYSQSIVLTAVNTILPAVFTKMIIYEG